MSSKNNGCTHASDKWLSFIRRVLNCMWRWWEMWWLDFYFLFHPYGCLAYIIPNTSLFRGQGYHKYQGFHCVLISTRSWYFLYRKCSVNCSHPFLCWRINLKPKNNICPSSTGAGLYGIKCSIVHFNGLRSRIRWERWICLLPSSLLRASVQDSSLPMSH